MSRAASIHREITPLTQGDCLMVFDRPKKNFDFPVHFHPEYEINLIQNGRGAKRFVGDHIGSIGNYEMVITGPNVIHGWEQGECKSRELHEITIQFQSDLLGNSLLDRNIMKPIKDLLNRSQSGILFSEETTQSVLPRIHKLTRNNGFDSFIELVSLLYDLANARNQQILSTAPLRNDEFYNSSKIKKVYDYIRLNYQNKIKLEDIAAMLNMTSISFSRLIKQRTGKTFVEFLNDYRIGCATRLLIESNDSIAEIAFKCGFNNMANFNRIFKKSKGYTPSSFRSGFSGVKKFY
jgi:AraC-like DNA-binding protein